MRKVVEIEPSSFQSHPESRKLEIDNKMPYTSCGLDELPQWDQLRCVFEIDVKVINR